MKDDKAYIKHMLLCIGNIVKFTKGLHYDAFADNEFVRCCYPQH